MRSKFIEPRELLEFLYEKFHERLYIYDEIIDIFKVSAAFSIDNEIRFSIKIDDRDHSFRAQTRKLKDKYYEITLSHGLMVRVMLNIYSLLLGTNYRRGFSEGAVTIQICDHLHHTIDSLNPADLGHLDENRFPKMFRPVFFPYKSKRDLWIDIDELWKNIFDEEISKSDSIYIPFLWCIDFIVMHEIAHILTSHFDYINERKLKLSRKESSYVEGLADYMAAKMQAFSIDSIGTYCFSGIKSEALLNSLEALAFIISSLFSFIGTSRLSFRKLSKLSYPHPDFRWKLAAFGLAELFADFERDDSLVFKAFSDARGKLNLAYSNIGVFGMAVDIQSELWSALRSDEENREISERFLKYYRGVLDISSKLGANNSKSSRAL